MKGNWNGNQNIFEAIITITFACKTNHNEAWNELI